MTAYCCGVAAKRSVGKNMSSWNDPRCPPILKIEVLKEMEKCIISEIVSKRLELRKLEEEACRIFRLIEKEIKDSDDL